jgi:CxxC-x17-CxxC domain-containing protein
MASNRKMHDVRVFDLKCAGCGKPIEELPFLPLTDRPVYCSECNRTRSTKKSGSKASRRRPRRGTRGGSRRR